MHIADNRRSSGFFYTNLKVFIIHKYVKRPQGIGLGWSFLFYFSNQVAEFGQLNQLVFFFNLFYGPGLDFRRRIFLAVFPFQKPFSGNREKAVQYNIVQVLGKTLGVFFGLF